MSLRFIIDGYNIIHHPEFARLSNKKIKDDRARLVNLISSNKLAGSPKNKITIVFDGYLGVEDLRALNDADSTISVISSGEESADERIKKIVEGCVNQKTVIVVSDDKQIRLAVRYLGATPLGVDEFIGRIKKPKTVKESESKTELTYSQMQRINEELGKLWLK